MKNLTKAVVAAGVALALQSAKGQQSANDLILGFNGFSVSGTASDYIADLGNAGTILAGGPGQDLSSSLTGFTAVYSSSLNVGAVAGQNGATPDAYMTTVRTGGGSYTTAGTELAPTALPHLGQKTAIASAGAIAEGTALGTTASSTVNLNSWTQEIAAGPAAAGTGNNSFVAYLYGATSSLPNQSPSINFGDSSTIVEDLWEITPLSSGTASWNYVGNLTVDVGGSQPSVIFDLQGTPEPGTFGLLTAGGILLLAIRGRYFRKSA